jgi:parvulin-like peptidyl-prolyl isomerase
VAVSAGLAGCGESTTAHIARSARAASEQLHAPTRPTAVAARVGPYSITGAALDRFLVAAQSDEPASELLVPPRFSACVAHLEAQSAAADEPRLGTAQLARECQTRYQELQQTVLDRLISDDWLIGGARELGVHISDGEVRAGVDRYRREHFSSDAQFRRLLAGRTVADLAFETRAKLAAEAIRQALDRRVGPIGQAAVVSYYDANRLQYLVTAERDLKIARTATEAAAAKVKAEVASGKSFASVVKHLPIGQPINSRDGLVRELQPHVYGEPSLNQAIFTAKPGVLTGPIQTWFGYFVFDVTRVRFQHERPLREVQASIRRQLISPLQQRALAAFVKQWTAAWTARTSCSPETIAPKCRQYKGGSTGPAEEPSPLS